MSLFSFGMHKTDQANFETPFALNAIDELKDEGYRRAPDYLGSAIEKIFDYVKREFIN